MTKLTTDYRLLVPELLEHAIVYKQPASGTFELTNNCNIACRMCYVRSCTEQSKELSASEWLILAQDAVDNGMVFLTLTGGEILLRPDFFEIYEPLSHMGLVLTIFTNGTLITDEFAKRLTQYPPNLTKITLYGASRTTYKAITGSADAFNRCCSGIETFIKRGIPVGLKTTITQQNIDELESMQQMARNWGLPITASWLLSDRRDGKSSEIEKCRLSPQEGVKLESLDHTYKKKWLEARKDFVLKNGNFYCRAGKATFAVTPSGEMNVCLNLPLPAVHPLKIGFQKAWELVQLVVETEQPDESVCDLCDVRGYCQICPAWSYNLDRSLTTPVPYICEIAQERKKIHNKGI